MWSNPKVEIWRSEQHRRNVATLPCAACGRRNYTQAAHIGALADGKGLGWKVSDSRVASLCTLHPSFLAGARHTLEDGCHEKFDRREWLDIEGVLYDLSDESIYERASWVLLGRTYVLLIEGGLLKVGRA